MNGNACHQAHIARISGVEETTGTAALRGQRGISDAQFMQTSNTAMSRHVTMRDMEEQAARVNVVAIAAQPVLSPTPECSIIGGTRATVLPTSRCLLQALFSAKVNSMVTIRTIEAVGLGLLRYGLAFLLVMIGSFKFFAFEAEAIRPLLESSPLLAWLYDMLGARGAAALVGTFEVLIGALISTRRWFPHVSGYASLAASSMFLVTLSFLVTTPGALAPTSPYNQFLWKDIVLLGAALLTAAEALGTRRTTAA